MSEPQQHAYVPQIPVTAGIPRFVLMAFGLGIAIIIATLYVVGATASYGRVWPSEDSAKIHLSSNANLK